MTALEKFDFIADDQIRPFVRDHRADLLASDIETIAGGQYVILKHRVKQGQIEIIKNIVPYADRRTNVGVANERFEKITPQEGNGFFAFTPLVNNQPLFTSEINYNAPRKAAGTLSNNDRQKRSGLTALSLDPWADAQRNPPSYFAVKLPSDTELVVTFEILPAANTSPLTDGAYQIAVAADEARRVDFAGVVIAGVVMPQSVYDRLVAPPSSGGGSGGGIMGSLGPACG